MAARPLFSVSNAFAAAETEISAEEAKAFHDAHADLYRQNRQTYAEALNGLDEAFCGLAGTFRA